MRVSAKAEYAVRAMIELASPDVSDAAPAKRDRLAKAQAIPVGFLGNILGELRQHGLVHGRPGSEGGYWLGKPAGQISIAEIIRAVEGPLATVRGESPDSLEYSNGAADLKQVWIALRTNIRDVLEAVMLADLVAHDLPANVRELAERPGRPGTGEFRI